MSDSFFTAPPPSAEMLTGAAESVPAPASSPSPVEGSLAQAPAAPPADPTYDVTVDGQTLKNVPLKELLAGYSRTAKFTQSQQALAAQRREFEQSVQAFQQQQEALKTFLSDSQQVEQYLQLLRAKQGPAPQAADPSEVLTLEQVRALQAQQAQALTAQVEQRLQAERDRLEVSSLTHDYQTQLAQSWQQALSDHPILGVYEDLSDLVLKDVRKMGPRDVGEAKEFYLMAAKARAERLESSVSDRLKATAVQQSKLVSQNIEPPGGRGLVPTPNTPSLIKGSDIERKRSATAYLEALNAGE